MQCNNKKEKQNQRLPTWDVGLNNNKSKVHQTEFQSNYKKTSPKSFFNT